MDRARAKIWAKRAGIALGGLLFLLTLAVSALFIWLGTDSARRMVLGFAEDALAAQGLRLEVRETAGQLPFSLDLDGVSLADSGGQWLLLDRLHLSLSPFKLLGLTAQVDSLRLEGLDLARLPVLPPSEPVRDEPRAPQNSASIWDFAMPIGVRINELALLGARVQPEFLATLLPEQRDEILRMGAVDLDIEAWAGIRPGAPRLEAGLQIKLRPGSALPEGVKEFVGEALELSLRVSGKMRRELAELRIKSLRLGNHLLMAGLDDAVLRVSGQGPQLDFDGQLLAAIKDEKFFSLLGVEDGVPLFGKSDVKLAVKAETDLGSKDPSADFSIRGPVSVESRYELFCGAAPSLMQIDLDLAGRFDGVLGLSRLRVSGLGLDIDGEARLVPSPLDIRLDAKLDGARRGEWLNILQRLSGGVPALGLKSVLEARLSQNVEGGKLELDAKVDVSAWEFVWYTKELEKAFGTYAAAQVEFSGPVVSPYAIKVHGVSTGFEPVLPAPYVPGQSLPPGTSARGRGSIEISIPGVAPLASLEGHSKKEQTRLTSLNGQAEATVADIGLFVPAADGEQGSLSGPGLAKATISGLAGRGATSLYMTAKLDSPEGAHMESPLGDLTFSAEATTNLTVRDDVSLVGSALLNAETPKAGPLHLKSGWSVLVPQEPVVKLGFKDLDTSFAGLSLTGNAQADIPYGKSAKNPALGGKIVAHFENWAGLNNIFQRLELAIPPVNGSPIDLIVEMQHGAAGQSATLNFNLERLHMLMNPGASATLLPEAGKKEAQLGTPGMLLVNDTKARVEISDLWGKRLMSAQASTGPGSVDIELWESAAVYLDFVGNTGRINMAMRDDAGALASVQAFDADAPIFTSEMVEKYLQESGKNGAEQSRKKTPIRLNGKDAAKAEAGLGEAEMAALAGIFRLNPFALRLERAAMYAPEYNTGFYLRYPAFISVNDDVIVKDVDFAILPNGFLQADAHFSASQSRASANIKDLPLALVRKLFGIPLPDGELSLSSTINMRDGNFGGETEVLAALRPLDSRTLPDGESAELTLRLKGVLDSSSPEFKLPSRPGLVRLTGSGSVQSANAGRPDHNDGLRLAFDIPLHSRKNGMLELDSEALLAATLGWKGELSQVWALLPVADRYLNGMGQFDFKLGGSLSKLQYGGSAYLAGARYEDRVNGFMLEGINLEALASPKGSKLVMAAKDGRDGSLALEAHLNDNGIINTGIGGGEAQTQPRLEARGQIKHLAPLHRDDLYLRLSGVFEASGALLSPDVKGNFEIEQGNLNLLASLGGSVETLLVELKSEKELKKEAGQSPILDISVEAPRRFYVRGPGLDSEWKLSASLKGQAANPQFSATITPVRGYFDLLSRPFAFSKGQIKVWRNNGNLDSDLDLLLSYKSASLTAEVSAGGSIKRPTLTMGSTPAMPQDQIMAQVIFGKDVTQLSAVEALQVANGVRQLMSFGQGGFDFVGEARALLGVDTLRIGSSSGRRNSANISGSPDASVFGVGGGADEQAESTPAVEAGKYINDSIYVGVEQGTVENSTRVRVEIELKPNLTLEGSSGGDSSQVGLGWKRDY